MLSPVGAKHSFSALKDHGMPMVRGRQWPYAQVRT